MQGVAEAAGPIVHTFQPLEVSCMVRMPVLPSIPASALLMTTLSCPYGFNSLDICCVLSMEASLGEPQWRPCSLSFLRS